MPRMVRPDELHRSHASAEALVVGQAGWVPPTVTRNLVP
jgi:hypothetical protein